MSVMLLVSHEVRDFDAWKHGFDAHRPARVAAGFVDVFVGRDASKPNLAHVGFTVPSVEAARGFLADPGLKDAMVAAGVTGAPDARILVTG